MKFPGNRKKVFIWYKVLIEISQEVEASSPKVEKGIDFIFLSFWIMGLIVEL